MEKVPSSIFLQESEEGKPYTTVSMEIKGSKEGASKTKNGKSKSYDCLNCDIPIISYLFQKSFKKSIMIKKLTETGICKYNHAGCKRNRGT